MCLGAQWKVGHKLALQRPARKSAPVAAAAAENPGTAEARFQGSVQGQEDNTGCILALLKLSPWQKQKQGSVLGHSLEVMNIYVVNTLKSLILTNTILMAFTS